MSVFFIHLVSLSGDEPLWKKPAGFRTVRTSVSCVADSEYCSFSLFAFHNVNCHWMGGWGKPLLLYMNMCTVCVLACHSLLLINLSNCNRTINICFYKYTGCSVSVCDFTSQERKYCTVINILVVVVKDTFRYLSPFLCTGWILDPLCAMPSLSPMKFNKCPGPQCV